MTTHEQELLQQIERYTKAANMAESTFGRLAVNDGKLVDSLRRGSTVTLKTLRKIQLFIANHPPVAPVGVEQGVPT